MTFACLKRTLLYWYIFVHSISFATIDFIFVFIHIQPSTITHLIYALLYCNLHPAYNGGWKTQFAMCVPLLLNQPTYHLPSYLKNHSISYNFISHYTKTILKMLAKFKTHSTILIKGEYILYRKSMVGYIGIVGVEFTDETITNSCFTGRIGFFYMFFLI